jgi:hypothetical protein
MVFQVMNSGYSASGSAAGSEWVLRSGVVAVVLGSREDEEEEEGVDKLLEDRADRRSKAGFRSEMLALDGAEELVTSSSSSSSSCKPFWYEAHKAST